MRLPLLAAGTALLLCTTAAMAQNNAPNTPTASPSASTANTGTTSTTRLRDNIRGMLQRSGFSDIRIMPSSFMIRAKDQQGNPVMMSVSPGSVTEVSELGTSSGTGSADNSADAATSGVSGSQFVAVDQNEKLSSNLVGLDVYNASNQDIGQIKDIAVGPAGRARAYIVSVGGFLGMGTHYVAMNPSAVQVSYNTSDQKWHATTNTTSDQLKSAPAFQYTGRWDASKS
ncbi:MAG: PRC-barrel domain-containing protein [Steroidobacteraceae bacterium]